MIIIGLISMRIRKNANRKHETDNLNLMTIYLFSIICLKE